MTWFGGKRRVAAEVWQRFGEVRCYVEPFFGSGAVLLGRPPPFVGAETVNDRDGLICNFWRAIKYAPDAVARFASDPVNENDLHARHIWLVQRLAGLRARLEGGPCWYDPKIAGWWVWGICCWIGGGFGSGAGPWHLDAHHRLVRNGNGTAGDLGRGVQRKLPHLGDLGRGVQRKRPHLSDLGQGVKRQRPHLDGDDDPNAPLVAWFRALAARFRHVRVCSGDWSRVCGPSVTYKHGLTGVFLDPPYPREASRDPDLYTVDDLDVAYQAREWAIENGKRPDMRIALCGYEGTWAMPDDWSVLAWNAGAGYSGQGKNVGINGKRERIWFSPACLPSQPSVMCESE